LGRFRRLSRCFERLAATDESMIRLAMIRLMLRRIVNPERETWRGTIAFQTQAWGERNARSRCRIYSL
jgi:hypothetical protein